MKLSNADIRRIILAEHHELRKRLELVSVALSAVEKGDAEAEADLVARINYFYDTFLKHIGHEERILEPVLKTIDAWGGVRTMAMDQEHAEQRAEIERLRALNPRANLERYAFEIRTFIEALYKDMAHEEATCLDERVLRNDVIVIDGISG